MKQIPVITVDGPSGSGKGTLCQSLAQRLGWHLLDSGAIYRVLAHAAHLQQVDVNDVQALVALCQTIDVSFLPAEGHNPARVLLDEEDVSQELRSETTGNAASKLAAIPEVRAALLQLQRDFVEAPGLVADGRDLGTVVFPKAPLKIFLTASVEERARRRFEQLKGLGQGVSLSHLLDEMQARDQRDRERAVAPLVPADDAVLLDSTTLSVAEVELQVFALLRERAMID